jgi:hypothetical protein
MTFENIQSNCWNGVYSPPPNLGYKAKTLDKDTVIDEDKSVKWNREEVERRNEKIEAEWRAQFDIKIQRYQQFRADMLQVAKSEYEMNEAQFEKLYEFVMYEYSEHDYMCAEFVRDFEQFCDFFFDVVNTR